MKTETLFLSALLTGAVLAGPCANAAQSETPEALKQKIEAMRPARHVWREIQWKTCLLEGLQEARARNKPVLLWVFIHHPNDERC
ncbi:MAG TPA: hypothetical protein VFB38_27410 [Chthonomonadaceae bacterium]|nr:hypothetical protein [Chthonomonadaceae bacterium]